MNELNMWVFNVERGLCVLLRTPNGYGVMIDCGRSANFSPAEFIASSQGLNLTIWKNNKLAWLVVTHPHDDHVEDIDNIKNLLSPALLCREKDYDWNAVLSPPDHDPSKYAKEYYEWQKSYQPVLNDDLPNLGCKLRTFALSPNECKSLNSDSQHLLNNSCSISVFSWPVQNGTWKVVVCGDNEVSGIKKLLERADFRNAINGAHFFVTPHHGHNSGYTPELFEAMGKPLCNITSERLGDESVAKEYKRMAQGVNYMDQQRRHLTTRKDGHIFLRITREGYQFK